MSKVLMEKMADILLIFWVDVFNSKRICSHMFISQICNMFVKYVYQTCNTSHRFYNMKYRHVHSGRITYRRSYLPKQINAFKFLFISIIQNINCFWKITFSIEQNRTEYNRIVELSWVALRWVALSWVELCWKWLLKYIKSITWKLPEYWQAWGINPLSRKPVSAFDYLHGKEKFPNVQSELLLVHLWAIPACPAVSYWGEVISTSPLQEFLESNEIES